MKIQVEVEVPDGDSCFDCEWYDPYPAIGRCWQFDENIDGVLKCPACLKACEEARKRGDA